jgi:hypothetical protein
MKEKNGMLYLDMKFSVKEEHWEELKKRFERLGLGINDVLKQTLNDPEFIKYVLKNSRKFKFKLKANLKEKETKVYLEKEVYQRIKELMKELRVTQKILTSMAIMYYVENSKPKKAQVDMTLEVKKAKKSPQIVI